MRKIVRLAERKEFTNDQDILLAVDVAKGDFVLDEVNFSQLNDMMEGESRVDSSNNRMVKKIKGELYKQVVDADSNVVFEKL